MRPDPFCVSYLTVLRYVERNPLRANMVERSQDREWSSLKPTVRSGPEGLLSDGPILKPCRWSAVRLKASCRRLMLSPLSNFASLNGGNASIHTHVNAFTQEANRPVEEQKAGTAAVITAKIGNSMWSSIGAGPGIEERSSGQLVKGIGHGRPVDGFHRAAPSYRRTESRLRKMVPKPIRLLTSHGQRFPRLAEELCSRSRSTCQIRRPLRQSQKCCWFRR